MQFVLYLLPDGSIVPVDMTVAKFAETISYQLKGGTIVTATRLDLTTIGRAISPAQYRSTI